MSVQTAMIFKEKDLQAYSEKLLKDMNIEYHRIPDSFWRLMHMKCTNAQKCFIYKIFGGLPDLTVQIPIDDKFSLCCNLELKKQGSYLRKGQKESAEKLPWVTVRTIEQLEDALNAMQDTVNTIRENL